MPPHSTPEPPGLRRATADDLPAIKAIIDAAYTRYLTRMDKPPAPMLRDYAASVADGTTWVTGSPVTAVLTLYPRDDHLLVENVAVHPSAQGQGLGGALMSFAEQEATRRGLTRMALVTHEVMTENQAIYARLGYVEVARRAEDGYRRIFMEKRLDPHPARHDAEYDAAHDREASRDAAGADVPDRALHSGPGLEGSDR
jgi:GNAT superfamily N-acetyltransferase